VAPGWRSGPLIRRPWSHLRPPSTGPPLICHPGAPHRWGRSIRLRRGAASASVTSAGAALPMGGIEGVGSGCRALPPSPRRILQTGLPRSWYLACVGARGIELLHHRRQGSAGGGDDGLLLPARPRGPSPHTAQSRGGAAWPRGSPIHRCRRPTWGGLPLRGRDRRIQAPA
jgi:hypothetical protein